jgi:Hemingway/CFA97
MEFKERWYYDHLLEMHSKKLKMIKSQSGKRIDNSSPATLKLTKARLKAQAFLKNQEYKDLFKKNQVILNTLNEISNRKVIIIQKKNLLEPIYYNPGGLNENYKKRELEKITHENDLMYQRLSTKEPTVSVKKMDEDYKQSLKYKKKISKKNFFMHTAKSSKKKLIKKVDHKGLDPIKTTRSEKKIYHYDLEDKNFAESPIFSDRKGSGSLEDEEKSKSFDEVKFDNEEVADKSTPLDKKIKENKANEKYSDLDKEEVEEAEQYEKNQTPKAEVINEINNYEKKSSLKYEENKIHEKKQTSGIEDHEENKSEEKKLSIKAHEIDKKEAVKSSEPNENKSYEKKSTLKIEETKENKTYQKNPSLKSEEIKEKAEINPKAEEISQHKHLEKKPTLKIEEIKEKVEIDPKSEEINLEKNSSLKIDEIEEKVETDSKAEEISQDKPFEKKPTLKIEEIKEDFKTDPKTEKVDQNEKVERKPTLKAEEIIESLQEVPSIKTEEFKEKRKNSKATESKDNKKYKKNSTIKYEETKEKKLYKKNSSLKEQIPKKKENSGNLDEAKPSEIEIKINAPIIETEITDQKDVGLSNEFIKSTSTQNINLIKDSVEEESNQENDQSLKVSESDFKIVINSSKGVIEENYRVSRNSVIQERTQGLIDESDKIHRKSTLSKEVNSDSMPPE